MQPYTSTPIQNFPYDDLQKVEDLMYYDGPILSHYKNEKERNFLFYWVDYNDEFNRWLVWDLSESILYDYLRKDCTLQDTMRETSLFFTIDVDDEIEYRNAQLLLSDNIPEKYLKGADSYYTFPVPAVYKDLIYSKAYSQSDVKKSPTEILRKMREDGYYFRLQAEGFSYGRAIKLKDAGSFLVEINKSAAEYARNAFYNDFKEEYSDSNKLNKALSTINKHVEPFMVNTSFNSFEVMLSIDSRIGFMGESIRQRDWRKSIFSRYNRDVINVDYEAINAPDLLAERFPDEQVRNRIIQPILKILSNKDYSLEVRDSKDNVLKKHKNISKDALKRLGKEKVEETTKSKKKLYNIVIEANEKDGQITYSNKSIREGLIFQSELDQVEVDFSVASYGNTEIIFKKPVVFRYYIDADDSSNISNADFDIALSGKTRALLLREAQKTLVEKVVEFINSEDPKQIAAFDEYVEEIVTT